MTENIAGAILAGGKSSRFGSNKALALYQGVPLVQRIARILADIFPETILVTNSPGAFAFLGWPMTGDRFRDCGPLAGIHAALSAATCPAAFVCGCDMPLVQPALVRFLCDRLADNDAVLPWPASGPEPLYAVYSKTALPVIEENLRQGQFRTNRVLDSLRVRRVTEEEILAILPDLGTFCNINRQSDLLACPEPDGAGP